MSEPAFGRFVSMLVECRAGHRVTVEAPSLSRTGGCFGHGDEERCYCPEDEFEVEFSCPQCPAMRPAQKAKLPR